MRTMTVTRRGWLATFGLALALIAGAAQSPAHAASAAEINADVYATMQKFQLKVRSGHDLSSRAAGILVFPTVVKAGMGIGGEYGEGALLVGGRPVDYYNTISASIGFQLGALPPCPAEMAGAQGHRLRRADRHPGQGHRQRRSRVCRRTGRLRR